MHEQKIECTEEELCRKFTNLWPVFNRLWPKYRPEPITSHQRFLDDILSNDNITHPSICELLRILISISPSTGSLEISFRNQLTRKLRETLYWLCQFKGNEVDYKKAIEILEK